MLAELDAANVVPRTTLLCFDVRILQLAYCQWPGLATCLLLENDHSWLLSIQRLGFVPTALGPEMRTVTAAAVQELRAGYPGLRLVPWTVNSSHDARQFIVMGVDGITTDYPNRLIASQPKNGRWKSW